MKIVVTDHDYMDFEEEKQLFNAYGASFTIAQCTNDKEVIETAQDAILVNAGRGPVIDETSLIEALQSNELKGAALDVLEEEPIRENHPFIAMENVILTPHVAFYSEEAMEELKKKTADNVIDLLKHKVPRYAVNANKMK